MNQNEEAIVSTYNSFKVLFQDYMKQEAAKNQVSKLKLLFKKVDQNKSANNFPSLLAKSKDALNVLQKKSGAQLDTDFSALKTSLIKCMTTFNNLLAAQIHLNKRMDSKAQGKKYPWNEYSVDLKKFQDYRRDLENMLPELSKLYKTALGN